MRAAWEISEGNQAGKRGAIADRHKVIGERLRTGTLIAHKFGPGTSGNCRQLWTGTLIETCGKRPPPSQVVHQSSTNLMCIGVVRQFEPPLRPRLRKKKLHRAPNSHTSPNESTREHKLRVVVNCFQMFQAFRGATRCSTPAPSGVARAELLHARRIPCFRSNSRAWSQARSMRGCQRELDRTALFLVLRRFASIKPRLGFKHVAVADSTRL